MFKDARIAAGLSREEAAFQLHIGTRTLLNYEHDQSIAPPEVALEMQEVYGDPTLTAKYCSEYCPIGQVYAHSMPDQLNLCHAVFGMLNEHTDVAKMRDALIAIMADGVIDQDELPIFEKVINELLDLEKKIEELKLAAASLVSIPAMMQKRRTTALAAK